MVVQLRNGGRSAWPYAVTPDMRFAVDPEFDDNDEYEHEIAERITRCGSVLMGFDEWVGPVHSVNLCSYDGALRVLDALEPAEQNFWAATEARRKQRLEERARDSEKRRRDVLAAQIARGERERAANEKRRPDWFDRAQHWREPLSSISAPLKARLASYRKGCPVTVGDHYYTSYGQITIGRLTVEDDELYVWCDFPAEYGAPSRLRHFDFARLIFEYAAGISQP